MKRYVVTFISSDDACDTALVKAESKEVALEQFLNNHQSTIKEILTVKEGK